MTDDKLRRRFVSLGKLAAFLDGYDGHPLDGIIAALNHTISPHKLSKEQEGWIRQGYHGDALTDDERQSRLTNGRDKPVNV
jgi:hypothetical protein